VAVELVGEEGDKRVFVPEAARHDADVAEVGEGKVCDFADRGCAVFEGEVGDVFKDAWQSAARKAGVHVVEKVATLFVEVFVAPVEPMAVVCALYNKGRDYRGEGHAGEAAATGEVHEGVEDLA